MLAWHLPFFQAALSGAYVSYASSWRTEAWAQSTGSTILCLFDTAVIWKLSCFESVKRVLYNPNCITCGPAVSGKQESCRVFELRQTAWRFRHGERDLKAKEEKLSHSRDIWGRGGSAAECLACLPVPTGSTWSKASMELLSWGTTLLKRWETLHFFNIFILWARWCAAAFLWFTRRSLHLMLVLSCHPGFSYGSAMYPGSNFLFRDPWLCKISYNLLCDVLGTAPFLMFVEVILMMVQNLFDICACGNQYKANFCPVAQKRFA